MKKKVKFFSGIVIFFGLTYAIVSCVKKSEDTIKLNDPNENLKSSIIEVADSTADAYRNEFRAKAPIIDSLWDVMNISFDESQLSEIVNISTSVSTCKDSIIISAFDKEGNTYYLQVLSSPYKSHESLKSAMWRWPTGNEWVCLGISLSGAIISGGIGTYATVANFIAICAAEDKSSQIGVPGDPISVVIQGWYNGEPEFKLCEDVFESIDGTHMNASLTLFESSLSPIFIAEGLITGENTNLITYIVPTSTPQNVWNNVSNPLNFNSIPNSINLLISQYKAAGAPYTLKSSRNVLLGELVRVIKE